MKKIKYLFSAVLLLTVSVMSNAQDAKMHLRDFGPKLTTVTFKVNGECGSCKRRIEKAVKVEGVNTAFWNEATQLLTVQYNKKLVKADTFYLRVAAAGHDTNQVKADDKVYNALPDCCHYRNI